MAHFSVWCSPARVRRESVHGTTWLSLRMGRGSVRVQCGSVQGAAWLSSGCGVALFRVRHGSVEGCDVDKFKGAPLLS
jgi:hypothetical protein